MFPVDMQSKYKVDYKNSKGQDEYVILKAISPIHAINLFKNYFHPTPNGYTDVSVNKYYGNEPPKQFTDKPKNIRPF